jgi:hypothetical protein
LLFGRIFSGTGSFGTQNVISAGGFDIFIAKLDASGAWQRVQRAGGAGIDYANGVEVDGAGNLFVTGYFMGTATFGLDSISSIGSSDLFLAKYNGSGVAQWVRTVGISGDYSTGAGVAVDASGNAYVCGTVGGIFAAKWDPSGARSWTTQPAPGFSRYGYGIGVNSSGNGAMCGYFTGTAFGVTTRPGGDGYVAGLSSGGGLSWFQHMWVDGAASSTGAYEVDVDSAGNTYVTGGFNGPIHFGNTYVTNAGSDDGYIAKYNSAGVLQWVQDHRGPRWRFH